MGSKPLRQTKRGSDIPPWLLSISRAARRSHATHDAVTRRIAGEDVIIGGRLMEEQPPIELPMPDPEPGVDPALEKRLLEEVPRIEEAPVPEVAEPSDNA
jgi:hypothetical protein